ncbi:MAG: folylpolyglutamate synthase/dihydrofolate synthase family protein [Candidatus Omnitrophota bacterium]|jgi:dihydrofolate synthase/folylpolyglutamate synthase
MTYRQSLDYLGSLINYERITRWAYKTSFKLERFRDFLDTIGNPQRRLRCVNVAGSKGKGSTCAFIAYMLKESGCSVGLYTSPHLSDLRERFRILHPGEPPDSGDVFEGMIPEDVFSGLVGSLRTANESFSGGDKGKGITFFEFCTAMAFQYFARENVDFCVLETGMGGRLDATNVVEAVFAVITPISYEHTQVLGRTLAEIAGEKAGIIKPAVNKRQVLEVISSPQMEPAAEVIRKRCSWTKSGLWEMGKDIPFSVKNGEFCVKGRFGRYDGLKIRLPGRHQVVNACAALAAVEAVAHRYKIKADVDSLRRGLYNTLWPGRCEVVSRGPLIVLDGAQNKASAAALKEAVMDNFSGKRRILILGISADKDVRAVCRELVPWADTVIITRADNPRACDTGVIEKEVLRVERLTGGSPAVLKTSSVKEALEKAAAEAASEDVILVAGSLFVAGEARDVITKR